MSTELRAALRDRPYADLLKRIGEVAAQEDIEAYAVGGLVRDLLIGRPTTDLDFVTVGTGTGIALAEAVADDLGGTTAHIYPNFGTAAIRLPTPWAPGVDEDADPLVLEFVAARKESYRRSSRKPIVEDGTLEDDQHRRDFTINAMAMHLHPERFGQLIDPFNGQRDLDRQTIDTPLDPVETFDDDPLRMIRAARFATQLEFRVSDRVFEAMTDRADRVEILSQERITEELNKMIVADQPSIGFKMMEASSILAHILPLVQRLKGIEERDGRGHKDNFYHTLKVLDNLAERTAHRDADATRWLRWVALFHDIAKPDTKRYSKHDGWTFHGHEDRGARMIPDIFRRLKLPMDERMQYVQKIIRLHHRPIALVDDDVTDSAVRRLLYEAGDDVDDLMTFVRSDVTSGNPHRRRRYLKAFDRVEKKMAEVEEKDRLRNFEPPVDGYEIMETLGIDEGVAVGIAKTWIREAILDGDIPNEHDPAFEYLMQIKDEALRRGELFETMLHRLSGPERRATGAIKDAVFNDDLPDDEDAALAHLDRVKRDTLAPAEPASSD
ncbi:tRNA nucleotidyltransferase [Longimonas halophila]|uniref:tRNA nucleotidyltransferase n=1 Tax=Longimonas halophila TaxID=1469170 RepID=A0A2H3NVL8_9BACT|nr:HD domain-containing protein [Longimonas halophila]PEN05810.1 tRNA nucleotidyltransferase [Longimonas halophila]